MILMVRVIDRRLQMRRDKQLSSSRLYFFLGKKLIMKMLGKMLVRTTGFNLILQIPIRLSELMDEFITASL